MIDIAKRKDIIEVLNAILNNGGTAEVKNERKRDLPENIVVVEIKRTVRTKKPEV